MRLRVPRFLVWLSVAAAPLGLVACDSLTQAAGRVVDRSGHPVAGALVILRRAGRPPQPLSWYERTDTAGRFGAQLHGGLRTPDAVLSACAPGYAPVEVLVPDQADLRGLTLTLRAGADSGALCGAPADAVVFGEPRGRQRAGDPRASGSAGAG